MLFDWFTFIAQFINFLILIYLLKRFLFKPVLKAVDEREESIAAKITDAENLKGQAISELNGYKQKSFELEQQRQEFLDNAIKGANEERNHQLKKLQAEIKALRLQHEESIKSEQKSLSAEIKHRAREEIFNIVRKVLSDLASSDLEEQITGVFIEKLKHLNDKEKDQMLIELRKLKSGLTVRTTYKLSDRQQDLLREALGNNHFGDLKIKFETVPSLISGIELVAGGFKLVWTIDGYLETIEEILEEVISSKT